jgi:hypothetical protein
MRERCVALFIAYLLMSVLGVRTGFGWKMHFALLTCFLTGLVAGLVPWGGRARWAAALRALERAGDRSQLNAEQRARLHAFTTRSRVLFIGVLSYMAVLYGAGIADLIDMRTVHFGMVPLLLAAGASVQHQLAQRCPRCGSRIGLQTQLVLPARCAVCCVPFRE